MIVCVCEGVSDREIRAAIQRGADSLAGLGQACRAGGDCGKCRHQLLEMLRQHGASRAERVPGPGNVASA